MTAATVEDHEYRCTFQYEELVIKVSYRCYFLARIDPLKSEIALFDEWDGVKFQKELPTFHPGYEIFFS